jgi:two-component system response regulator (stage 0 sporulation protein A)
VVALETPVDADRLKAALDALSKRPRALPENKAARLNALLDALGVPLHRGRDCLVLAVALAWHDAGRVASLKDGVYPEVARQTGLSPAQVERALRHAIDAAWRNGAIEHQHRIFGDTIDARRGKPTCGEMIAQLAEELRWEA